MSCAEWIQVICSALTFIAAVIIGVLQIRQNKKARELEERMDARDEARREDGIRSSAIAFISQHYAEKNLIPLCAVAAMHNPLFRYSRKLYWEFCSLPTDVQNGVLERCGLELTVETKNYFDVCLEKVERAFRVAFPEEPSPFYDHGKYLIRSLVLHGEERIPDNSFEYESGISDAVKDAFESPGSVSFADIKARYNFSSSGELEACRFVTTFAEYLAIFGANDEREGDYSRPTFYAPQEVESMEDLFLLALLEIDSDLVLE